MYREGRFFLLGQCLSCHPSNKPAMGSVESENLETSLENEISEECALYNINKSHQVLSKQMWVN